MKRVELYNQGEDNARLSMQSHPDANRIGIHVIDATDSAAVMLSHDHARRLRDALTEALDGVA